HHDARAIAVLANLGGFLTPVLLSTNRDAAVALFTYLAVLDAGMVASAYWRRWPELHVLSFTFTQLLYLAWFQRWYVGSPPPLGAPGVGPLLLVVHGAIALGFLTLTFPIQFAEHGTTIAWSVEGAALVWGGLRLRSGPLRIGGLIVLALGMARWLMIVADQPAHRGMFVADDPALVSTLVYIVATAIAARRYRTEGVRLTEPETYVRPT